MRLFKIEKHIYVHYVFPKHERDLLEAIAESQFHNTKLLKKMSAELDLLNQKIADQDAKLEGLGTKLDEVGTSVSGIAGDVTGLKKDIQDLLNAGEGATHAELVALNEKADVLVSKTDAIVAKTDALKTQAADLDASTPVKETGEGGGGEAGGNG